MEEVCDQIVTGLQPNRYKFIQIAPNQNKVKSKRGNILQCATKTYRFKELDFKSLASTYSATPATKTVNGSQFIVPPPKTMKFQLAKR